MKFNRLFKSIFCFILAITFFGSMSIVLNCDDNSSSESDAIEICNNGIDDDGDGYVDGNDYDCVEICNNGIDDDGDGYVDGNDYDCVEVCDNDIDDDGDGYIDEDDYDCQE